MHDGRLTTELIMTDPTSPEDLPAPQAFRLTTKLSLDELSLLTPEIRKELIDTHGLEVRITSQSDRVKELLAKAGLDRHPTEDYQRAYDRTNPGYDRVYDRG